jgi:hypothetical protein
MCWRPFFVALACQGKVGILNALKQKADSGCRQPRYIRKGTQYCGPLELPTRDALIFATYAVVLFTLLVQGFSLRAILRRLPSVAATD